MAKYSDELTATAARALCVLWEPVDPEEEMGRWTGTIQRRCWNASRQFISYVINFVLFFAVFGFCFFYYCVRDQLSSKLEWLQISRTTSRWVVLWEHMNKRKKVSLETINFTMECEVTLRGFLLCNGRLSHIIWVAAFFLKSTVNSRIIFTAIFLLKLYRRTDVFSMFVAYPFHPRRIVFDQELFLGHKERPLLRWGRVPDRPRGCPLRLWYSPKPRQVPRSRCNATVVTLSMRHVPVTSYRHAYICANLTDAQHNFYEYLIEA